MNSIAPKIEAMLEPLIRQHGLARVQRDLQKLLPRSRWDDWQCVANLARNVSRRLERQSDTIGHSTK